MNNYLATNLRFLRKQNNLSLKELAKVLNVGPTAVGGWETGYRTPNINKILLITDIFNISLDDFIKKDLRIEPYKKVECSKEYINKRIEDSELSFKKKKVLADFLEMFIDLD